MSIVSYLAPCLRVLDEECRQIEAEQRSRIFHGMTSIMILANTPDMSLVPACRNDRDVCLLTWFGLPRRYDTVLYGVSPKLGSTVPTGGVAAATRRLA